MSFKTINVLVLVLAFIVTSCASNRKAGWDKEQTKAK